MIRVHSDHVGSLLRPPDLLRAREALAAGRLEPSEFKQQEDSAVDRVVALQESAGCEVVTDGELRRLSFQSAFAESVEGLGEWDLDAFLWGEWHGAELPTRRRPRPPALGAVGRLALRRSLCAEEYTYLRARTRRVAKVTLPSPGLFANFWSPERSREAYPTLDAFLDDVAAILCREAAELVRLGCRYVQIDAPHYPLLLDARTRSFYERQGWTADRWLERGMELDNAVLDAARGATAGFHLCRGNQESRWLASGGYEPIARRLFRGIRAGRLLLEYDDERSGDFQPLRHVPDDKMVVLGVMTTKSPRLEPVEELAARVREAARRIDLERLAVSPQCGFSTSIAGNALSEADEAAKLRRLAEAASAIWGTD